MSKTVFIPAENCTDPRLLNAIKKANDEIGRLIDAVAKHGNFYMADCSGAHIARRMREFKGRITVNQYRSHRFSRAIGYFIASRPDDAFVNSRYLNRTPGSIAATLVHEWIHALDARDMLHSYGHGDNRWTKEKEETAPYKIDDYAERLINNRPTTAEDRKINVRIVNKSPRWYKPWTWWRYF